MRRGLIVITVLLATLGVACDSTPTSTAPTPIPSYPAPPLAILMVGEAEQIAGQGSYCWRDPKGRPLCMDMIGIATAQEALLTESPFEAHLRVPIEQPLTELLLDVIPVTDEDEFDSNAKGSRWWRPKGENQERFPLASERDVIVDLSLEPGLFVLKLSAWVQERGSASYGFLVEVR